MTLSPLESDVGEEERVEGEEEKTETTPVVPASTEVPLYSLSMSISVAGRAPCPLQRVLDPPRPHLIRLFDDIIPFLAS